MFYFIVEILPL